MSIGDGISPATNLPGTRVTQSNGARPPDGAAVTSEKSPAAPPQEEPYELTSEDILYWCETNGDYSMPPPGWRPPPREQRVQFVPPPAPAIPAASSWTAAPYVIPDPPPPRPARVQPAPNVPPRYTPPKPVIAILVDSVPFGEVSKDDKLPVHVGGGDKKKYASAVRECGGEVRWITPDGRDAAAQLEGVHGLLIPGGRDLHPELYDQKPQQNVILNMHPLDFDLWQFNVTVQALTMRLPIRGICRGMQLLNVIGGGTLKQDILKQMERPRNYVLNHVTASHSILILPQSNLGRQLKMQETTVNSSHHQGIDALSEEYAHSAISADGIVEGIERLDDPTVMGVQFHPERADRSVRTQFFDAFISDAAAYRKKNPPPDGAAKNV